jgi:hypothetical protein
MTYLISKLSQTKTVPDSFVAQTVKKRGLSAQWFLVDSKLVCKWFPADK